MSGTEGPLKRPDASAMGLVEQGAVKNVITAPDGLDYNIDKVETCLKKFDAKPDGTEWTVEEMDDGTAEAAGALAEVIKTEDGTIAQFEVREEA